MAHNHLRRRKERPQNSGRAEVPPPSDGTAQKGTTLTGDNAPPAPKP
ncbi:hypothetical protein [Prevotella dentasini]|nr:hypothetical protein [Prevotella dentasini]